MMWKRAVACLVLALLPREATGQDVAESLDALLRGGRLTPGDGAYVTVVAGNGVVEGDVRALSSNALTLTHGGNTQEFAEAEIAKIERRDSLGNGVAIGFFGALGVSTAMGVSFDQPYPALIYLGVVGGGAALIGGIVDANIRETVYRARGGRADLMVLPMLTTGGLGARLRVRW